MLTVEQAQEELRRLYVPDHVARQAEFRSGLPDAVAAAAAALGWETWHHDPGGLLDALSDPERHQAFRAVQPPLADALAAAWVALRADPYRAEPYQTYPEHPPFRAPGVPRHSQWVRAGWLRRLLGSTVTLLEQPPAWFAAWAGRLHGAEPALGRLLGVAIDAGDDAVFDVLAATARGEHEVGVMGRHLSVALLSAARPDGWELVEGLLTRAQRAEGLRQVILQAAEVAHPDAFRRLLRLVVDDGLTRFAAPVRAAAAWLGEPFTVGDRQLLDPVLTDAAELLADPAARAAALGGDDPRRVYLALWAIAWGDAVAAVAAGAPLLAHPAADHRLAAARLLAEIGLPEAERALVPAVLDADLRVAAVAFGGGRWSGSGNAGFDALRHLLDRVAVPVEVPVGLWLPRQLTLTAGQVADALCSAVGDRSPAVLAEFVPLMTAGGRSRYAQLLAGDPTRHRAALLGLLGDRAGAVRGHTVAALRRGPAPTADEARDLEAVLRRQQAELRRVIIPLLRRQPDEQAAESVRRLLAGNPRQAEAGRELAGELARAGRPVPTGAGPPPPATRPYDLVEHDQRTPPRRPSAPAGLAGWRPGVVRAITSLSAWFAEHRDVEVPVRTWQGESTRPLAHVGFDRLGGAEWATEAARFPLPELFEPWWERTAPQLTDGGLEALLAAPALEAVHWLLPDRAHPADPPITDRWLLRCLDPVELRAVAAQLPYRGLVEIVLTWFAVRDLRPGWIDPLLDAVAELVTTVPEQVVAELPLVAERRAVEIRVPDPAGWIPGGLHHWVQAAVLVEATRPDLWSAGQRGRLWQLIRYLDEPHGTYDQRTGPRDTITGSRFGQPTVVTLPHRPGRHTAPLRLAARAVDDGSATVADAAELLLGEREVEDARLQGESWWLLAELTRRRRPGWLAGHPWLIELVDRIRAAVVAAEVARGERPGPMSELAEQVRTVHGAGTIAALVAALGSQKLRRGSAWADDGKTKSLSRLIQSCFPDPEDTPEAFAAAVRGRGLTDDRLCELAVYAPQWAELVEPTLGWPGLADAVYWLHAHNRDARWRVDEDVRQEWAAHVHERTTLAPDDLLNGAVDAGWLGRVRETLGDQRFDVLLGLAKYTSSSSGHRRAQLFADAVRGRVDAATLARLIEDKRDQDAVRALGLLPLPADPAARTAGILSRYELMARWRAESRRFGAARRASEQLAVHVGLDNLARNSGYGDPQRLTWAMEAEAVRDLAGGPLVAQVGDVTVTLGLDDRGRPDLTVRRGSRTLASVPKAAAADGRAAELLDRATALRQQATRMCAALEEAMVRGDSFAPAELAELLAHPMLAPLLRDLVLVTERGLAGFPRGDGRRLADPAGAEVAADGSPLRIAHPVDLLATAAWSGWQHACFAGGIRQPFKQVFRELYVPTEVEIGDVAGSRRYAGQQLNPGRATRLLGTRGWVVHPHGYALRAFHHERLTAHLVFSGSALDPADIGGLTIESFYVTPVQGWQQVRLDSVPPRLFSEAMRDVDLLVSVAHIGGVNPETSLSTVEMRAGLVRETAELLGLSTVEVTANHVLVGGVLGSYSIHLGSGVVHRRPGNALCIVPVDPQHRGRLFLPFTDDDPRTAEILAKVVLLARDDQITDPTILEQLHR